MEEKKQSKNLKFFAAANTYNGFVSYFDRVFKSEDFDRIYVLKGGPGTGKSSFMKKISGSLEDKKCQIEEIYCSSDPYSLDGIIAEKNNRKIAILDGTAPHERDAIIPGAIDEIINLGDSWDSRWLAGSKTKILSLINEKSNAYKTAYSYLKIAGTAGGFIMSIYSSAFDKNKAKIKAEEIFADISACDKPTIATRLISSFGRYGEYGLDTLSDISKRQICVVGKEESTCLFLDICNFILKERKASYFSLPLALDSYHTDALYIPNAGVAVIRSESGEINADEFITDKSLSHEKLKNAKQIKKDALAEAQRWFGIASELHFELEKIYGSAMDFTKNDIIISEKLTEIENILEIER